MKLFHLYLVEERLCPMVIFIQVTNQNGVGIRILNSLFSKTTKHTAEIVTEAGTNNLVFKNAHGKAV